MSYFSEGEKPENLEEYIFEHISLCILHIYRKDNKLCLNGLVSMFACFRMTGAHEGYIPMFLYEYISL
jgi:hypothetical protein